MKDANYDTIWELFHGKCVLCPRPAVAIHEIVPKSQLGKKALEIDNRVTLCATCHGWAHDVGSKISIPVLREKRKYALSKRL